MIKYCGECGADLRKTNGICENCAKKHKYSSNGVINKVNIKEGAKEVLDKHFWKIFRSCFFVYVVMFLSALLIDKVLEQETPMYFVASLIRIFVFMPLSVGLLKYILDLIRDKDAKFDDIFRFYDKRIFLVFSVGILVSVISVLWSFLFIIPGIIVYLSYSLCNYVLVDNDNLRTSEILAESKRLTNGYKGDIFLFALSFVGWLLLALFTFGIVLVYVIPYISVSFAMYYEELKRIKQEK